MATLVIYENNNKEELFGAETNKLLEKCEELFHVALRHQGKEAEKQLLKKIFGIAKAHGLYITWYGNGCGPCEPDRFLVSGRGVERLALIQC